MPWASLDDSFYDHPKIVAIGNEAAGVLARSIAYCARHLTDGVIAREVVLNIAGTRRSTVVRTLIEAGFYTEHGTRGETRDSSLSHSGASASNPAMVEIV